MFNLFKKFFGPKLSIIDKMIQFFGADTVLIWNGINYSKEYMIPVSGRKPKDWNDPNFQWIKIGFGIYVSGPGNWAGGVDKESCPVIEVWIDRDLNIMRTERNIPYFSGEPSPRKFEKQVSKLYEQLQDVRKFSSTNDELNIWIRSFFRATPRSRYAHAHLYKKILTSGYFKIDNVVKQFDKDEGALANEEAHKRNLEMKAKAELERKEAEVEHVATTVTPPAPEIDIEAMLGVEHKKEKLKKGKHR